MARLRMDGFVSLKGGVEWGSVLTRPLVVSAERLHMNVDSWRGKVLVEVLDAETGGAVTGFARDDSIPVTIDSTDEIARWNDMDDLSGLIGKTVRLRFSLWQAELYSFWFGP